MSKGTMIKIMSLIFCFLSLQVHAKVDDLNCNDIVYSVVDSGRKQFVEMQLETLYLSNAEVDLKNLKNINVQTAFYINGDLAFKEKLPLKLLDFTSYVAAESGEEKTIYVLELKLNSKSKAVQKTVWTSCTLTQSN